MGHNFGEHYATTSVTDHDMLICIATWLRTVVIEKININVNSAQFYIIYALLNIYQ